MKRIKYIYFAILLLATASCGKPLEPDVPIPAAPLERDKGQPLPGAPTLTNVIGAEGGEIAAIDQTIRVNIPAGAVEQNTTFSLQEVTNTLDVSSARSYRLLPRTVTFKKPVTIFFSYAGMDLTGTTADLLRLAYQDEAGYYRAPKTTVNHTDSKRLTVQTTHFGDWTAYRSYQLTGSRFVKRGSAVDLKIMHYTHLAARAGGEDDYVDTYFSEGEEGSSIQKTDWSLVGEGKLTPAKASCVYQAPSVIPVLNPVTVRVQLSGEVDPLGQKQVLLVQPITIEGDYFNLTMDGQTYALPDARIANREGLTYLTATHKDQFQVRIQLKATKPDMYKFYSPRDPQNHVRIDIVNLTNPDEHYTQYRTGCTADEPDLIVSAGALSILNVPVQAGKFLQGEIHATALFRSKNYCAHPGQKAISLEFNVSQL